ncbi:MAG: cbb3-type cytochrome c oxidase subunit I [bacterium]|nr:cbb3-type cytochrome c oxidase subunit I [bacterium]
MNTFPRDGRPVAVLVLMAISACALALFSGVAAGLTYTDLESAIRSIGLTLQHIRPIHESFAFAWVFLGGVAVVHAWLISTGGPLNPAERKRFAVMIGLWVVAGAGILVTLLAGRFTGREYAGYHPVFSVIIFVGWLLFAWNFFGRTRFSLRGQPVYVWMWTAAIPLFAVTFLEAHAYTFDWVSRQPIRDIAIQWKANGVMVGSFNLLAYGSMMWTGGKMRGDDRYSRSATAFLLFSVGIVNTFTNYGHHTFHLPQTPWVHWVSFLISMAEVLLLAKAAVDLWGLRRKSIPPDLALPDRFARSVTLWTTAMLVMAIGMSVPPLNSLIHGTTVVTAHAMGTMIGIDSMILWGALSWLIRQFAGQVDGVVNSRWMRRAVAILDLSLAGFLTVFIIRGIASGLERQLGPSAPDWSRFVSVFPVLMVAFGSVLAVTVIWMVVRWMIVLIGVLRSDEISSK